MASNGAIYITKSDYERLTDLIYQYQSVRQKLQNICSSWMRN